MEPISHVYLFWIISHRARRSDPLFIGYPNRNSEFLVVRRNSLLEFIIFTLSWRLLFSFRTLSLIESGQLIEMFVQRSPEEHKCWSVQLKTSWRCGNNMLWGEGKNKTDSNEFPTHAVWLTFSNNSQYIYVRADKCAYRIYIHVPVYVGNHFIFVYRGPSALLLFVD